MLNNIKIEQKIILHEDNDYLSWNKHDEIKQFIITELNKRTCYIPEEWNFINGTLNDFVKFSYKNNDYIINLSCKMHNSFGLQIETTYPKWHVFVFDTFKYNSKYKETLIKIFDTLFTNDS